jgi:hypothetical protein
MKQLLLCGLVITLFAAQGALACSIGPGSRDFEPTRAQSPDAIVIPTTPIVLAVNLYRGNSEDRNSCARFGALIIDFEDSEGVYDLGFLFELHSGVFPVESLPKKIVSPIRHDSGNLRLEFYWIDYALGEPIVGTIDATIAIRAVSPTLAEGQRVYIEVKSP